MTTTDVDDFLAHYGVKGMKWGQRRAHSKAMKSLDKAERKKLRDKQEKDVTKAREKLKSGKVKADLKAAKATYKEQKNVIGKVAARKALNNVRDKAMKDIDKANEYKNGKEVALAVGLAAGAVALSAIMQANR